MKLSHDRKILLLALVAGLPALIATTVLLWLAPISDLLRGTIVGGLIVAWLSVARAAQLRVIRPLQVIANLLAGLREGHFTLRAREEESDDVLGAVRREVNTLQETLKEQRLGALEADALLRRVMEEIDVAVFAFDAGRALRLVNRAGERLLGQPAERLIGRTAAQLGLEQTLEGETPRILELVVPGAATGKWEVRRRPFRQGGLPLDMVVLADISRVLRSEERQVWQRLVRVLSHEINNSLAPIKSLSGTMTSLLDRTPRAGLGERSAHRARRHRYARRRSQPFHGFLRTAGQAAAADARSARRGGLGAPGDPAGESYPGAADRRAVAVHPCRRRPARSGAHQPAHQRRRGGPGNWRRSRGILDRAGRHGGSRGS
jgi:PAS domain S-box-containing protein